MREQPANDFAIGVLLRLRLWPSDGLDDPFGWLAIAAVLGAKLNDAGADREQLRPRTRDDRLALRLDPHIPPRRPHPCTETAHDGFPIRFPGLAAASVLRHRDGDNRLVHGGIPGAII